MLIVGIFKEWLKWMYFLTYIIYILIFIWDNRDKWYKNIVKKYWLIIIGDFFCLEERGGRWGVVWGAIGWKGGM